MPDTIKRKGSPAIVLTWSPLYLQYRILKRYSDGVIRVLNERRTFDAAWKEAARQARYYRLPMEG